MNISEGQWRYSELGCVTTSRVGIVEGSKVICDMNHSLSKEVQDANGKLIAAAPDLLDACKQMLWAVDYDDGDELENGKQSAIEAIKKATE